MPGKPLPKTDADRAENLNYPPRSKARCEVSWKGVKLYLGPPGSAESFFTLMALREHLSEGHAAPAMKEFRLDVMKDREPEQWEVFKKCEERVKDLETKLANSERRESELEAEIEGGRDAQMELERSLEETIEQRNSLKSKRPVTAWSLAAAAVLICCVFAINGLRQKDLPPSMDGVVLSEVEMDSVRRIRRNQVSHESRMKKIAEEMDFQEQKGVKEWLVAYQNGEVSP